jgi:hypothetical protein
VTLTNGLLDREKRVDAARLWIDLCRQGWHHVAEQEMRGLPDEP